MRLWEIWMRALKSGGPVAVEDATAAMFADETEGVSDSDAVVCCS